MQVAVLLNTSPEPLVAESIFEQDMECVVLSKPDVGIKVTVVLRQKDDSRANRLLVDCASTCSFPLGNKSVNFRDAKPSIFTTRK